MDNTHGTPAAAPGYETSDANARGVFHSLVILGLVLLVSAFVCWEMFRYFTVHDVEAPASESPFANIRQLPLGPQLQVNPREDWVKYRDDQQKALETLGWENRTTGTVRVPIEFAMELLVKKGVPVQGEPAPATEHEGAPEANKKP